MNNAVYGKNNGKIKKQNRCKTCKQQKRLLKWSSKPSYVSQKIFGNDLVEISKNKVTLTLNKPAYIGICILELSKVLMYKFHFDYVKNKYSNNSRLLFTNTDSLIYEIKTKDVYKDFSSNEKMFDFSG